MIILCTRKHFDTSAVQDEVRLIYNENLKQNYLCPVHYTDLSTRKFCIFSINIKQMYNVFPELARKCSFYEALMSMQLYSDQIIVS